MKHRKQQLINMLQLQDQINSEINIAWRLQNSNWSLAILLETTKAIKLQGWGLWESQSANKAKLKSCLVDIWHLMLSAVLEDPINDTVEEKAISINNDISDAMTYLDSIDKISLLDLLQYQAGLVGMNELDISIFSQILSKAKISWNELYVNYIGINCLKKFRQSNGLFIGSYIMDWSCVPLTKPNNSFNLKDLDHLNDILLTTNISIPNIFNELTNELQYRYNEVLEKTDKSYLKESS